MEYILPSLPYSYDSLEPYIDTETMEIHHGKHHSAYVTKLNDALKNYPDLQKEPIDSLLKDPLSIPEDIRTAVMNNGGGHYNHSFFWKTMKKYGGGKPSGELLSEIKHSFNSFEEFKNQFSMSAATMFGSGWTWLVEDEDKSLKIIKTSNQDNPITQGLKPILVLDIWEHAYYLKYQNRRAEYIDAWWNIINWEEAQKNLKVNPPSANWRRRSN